MARTVDLHALEDALGLKAEEGAESFGPRVPNLYETFEICRERSAALDSMDRVISEIIGISHKENVLREMTRAWRGSGPPVIWSLKFYNVKSSQELMATVIAHNATLECSEGRARFSAVFLGLPMMHFWSEASYWRGLSRERWKRVFEGHLKDRFEFEGERILLGKEAFIASTKDRQPSEVSHVLDLHMQGIRDRMHHNALRLNTDATSAAKDIVTQILKTTDNELLSELFDLGDDLGD